MSRLGCDLLNQLRICDLPLRCCPLLRPALGLPLLELPMEGLVDGQAEREIDLQAKLTSDSGDFLIGIDAA
ncbi:MAG: hypothetical protein Q8S26_02435 [Azonexus sp.]|nr:hypothetical protein [Azonexus sp.]